VEAGAVCVGGGGRGELCLLLQNVTLQVDKEDMCTGKWTRVMLTRFGVHIKA